jgi:hypothetical protein
MKSEADDLMSDRTAVGIWIGVIFGLAAVFAASFVADALDMPALARWTRVGVLSITAILLAGLSLIAFAMTWKGEDI